ncbi:amidase [Undibacterium oligocarboniphilum]|uniref:Amidase n=1 Tax=Undibacterium oligocarboniphilum TaxID=666702 RepID=A0A850QDY7_9BURK|nr:amidase [Undibacterium oligocarboniphilum]MBC3869412.1 amidase [Undibacterium oligocarboniphilum]NVO77791.1 amidase [Undibacterium oligocarboniphilum]
MTLRRLTVYSILSLGCALLPVVASAANKMTPVPDHSDELAVQAQAIRRGQLTATALLERYQARIAAHNPALQAVIVTDPQAKEAAARFDALKKRRGALAGLPLLLKDNIDAQGMVTTAGSLALADNLRQKDAPLVTRLRDAGAIIVGKTNLSEWANLRSSKSTSGWSSAGGQVRNPYAPERSACGSSSGSGAAVAARMIPAAIGTETDGSIVCPAAVNGLVGLKPTIGLVSRTGIVPISHSQDTAGPMTLTVRDAAMVLNALAGSDPQDPATAQADRRRAHDYTAGLSRRALRGKRLGVVGKLSDGYDAEIRTLYQHSLELLRAQGAVLVPVELPNPDDIEKDEMTVLLYEFKADLNAYLAGTPDSVQTRSMADVIAFNQQHASQVMPYFGQDLMEQAQATGGLQDAAYQQAAARARQKTGKDGIDAIMKKYRLNALVAPTTGVAWPIDYPAGDAVAGSASTPAAVAGYPHLTVPMGLVRGLPAGISFFAGAWQEAALLKIGYAFEQARPALPAPVLNH